MSELYDIYQIDKKIESLGALKDVPPPKMGWISAIRQSLGMSATQLAGILKISTSRMWAIEKNEANQSIQLSTLEKAAEGMGCKVFYVIVPKNKNFLELVTEQARKIAKESVMKSAGHMVLENQEALKEIDLQIELLTQELLHKNWKELWNYEI